MQRRKLTTQTISDTVTDRNTSLAPVHTFSDDHEAGGQEIQRYATQKYLCQSTISKPSDVQVIIVVPILMTVDGQDVKPRSNIEVIQMRFVVETANLVIRSWKPFDQVKSIIHLLMTLYEYWIRLFANTTTVRGTKTSSVIPKLCLTCDSDVAKPANTVSNLKCDVISLHTTSTSYMKDCWIPDNIVEQKK